MKNIISAIKKSKRVGIIAHTSPDGDCLGSMSALSCILKQLEKEVTMFVDCNKIASKYDFFKLPQTVNNELNANDFDTLISVDVASSRLLGKYAQPFKEFKNTICIDHHANRDLDSKYSYIDFKRSSCCEIIFQIAVALKIEITPQIANYLFAGLVCDTNCFENDNTDATSHMIAAELIKYGANAANVIFIFHKQQMLADVNMKKIMYENLVCENGIGYFICTLKMQKKIGTDELGNCVNEILNMENNKFAFTIKQKEKNTYTVSLRCKEGYDVAKIAARYNGGGHTQAAGMMFVGSPLKQSKLLYNDCLEQIKEIEHVWKKCNYKL